jgi:thiol-disulfide isomerase/thioredoxin
MKIIHITLLLLLCTAFRIAPKHNNICRIIGNLSNTHSDTLFVFMADQQDTIILKNGRFDYSFISNNVTPVSLSNSSLANKRRKKLITKGIIDLIVIPNTPIIVTGSFDNYTISGSNLYNSIDKVRIKMKPINDEISNLCLDYENTYLKIANKDSLQTEFNIKIDSALKRRKEFALNYIKSHPNNEESAVLIPALGSDIDNGIKLLSNKVKNSEIAEYYRPYKERADYRKALVTTSKRIIEGTIAPDFISKDIKKCDFKLSSLRGKYVILDFWGSWCHWCIKGIPEMKRYYEKYKGKFEVVGIDCGDTESQWKAAVEKNQLPWLQVKNEKTNDITAIFGIQSYPTLIIINPDGKIMKRFLGEDTEFFTTLDNLFR